MNANPSLRVDNAPAQPHIEPLLRLAVEARDVTIPKLSAENAEPYAQAARFQTAIDSLSSGVCFFDRDDRLIACNRPYAEIYRLTPDQVTPGATLREIVERRLEARIWSGDIETILRRARPSRRAESSRTCSPNSRTAASFASSTSRWPIPVMFGKRATIGDAPAFDAATLAGDPPPQADTKPPPTEGSARIASRSPSRSEGYFDVKAQLHSAIVERENLTELARLSHAAARQEISKVIREIVQAQQLPLSTEEEKYFVEDVCDDMLGFGRSNRCWRATISPTS